MLKSRRRSEALGRSAHMCLACLPSGKAWHNGGGQWERNGQLSKVGWPKTRLANMATLWRAIRPLPPSCKHRYDACAMALVVARHVCSADIVVSMTRMRHVGRGEKGTRQGRQHRNLSGNLCMFCYDLRALPTHHLPWAGVGSGRPHWLILKADVR